MSGYVEFDIPTLINIIEQFEKVRSKWEQDKRQSYINQLMKEKTFFFGKPKYTLEEAEKLVDSGELFLLEWKYRGIFMVDKVKDLKRACIISSSNNINKINVSYETLSFLQNWINE